MSKRRAITARPSPVIAADRRPFPNADTGLSQISRKVGHRSACCAKPGVVMNHLPLSIALAALLSAAAIAGEGKPLEFPNAADGRKVIAVDLHTHSVFSDGAVWPTVRVEEARRDGVALIATTEHLEWQPKLDDIPHKDRNRSFEVARGAAQAAGVAVVNGAEITRGQPVGHINAVFLSDANPLLPPQASARNGEEMAARFNEGSQANLASARAAVEAAKAQGGFVFINHPSWTGQSKDGLVHLSAFHRKIIADKALDGIEVSNGELYSEEAFRIALENNLAILGVSDIHGLIAWDYETEFNGANKSGERGVRTATLVLASDASPAAIRKALFDRHAVAIQAKTLYGRARDLKPIVDGALSLTLGDAIVEYSGPTMVYPLTIANAAPTPFTLRSLGTQAFDGNARTFTVPARSSITVKLSALTSPEALRTMTFEVLNAHISPEKPLTLDLAVDRKTAR